MLKLANTTHISVNKMYFNCFNSLIYLVLISIVWPSSAETVNNDKKAPPLQRSEKQRPNIIFILADDAGWNDFSFHGSDQIPTPNIDALALNGVILNSYYSSPLCTPSRGATLSGKYAIRLGLQHYVILGGSDGGLPLGEKLLPEYLQELGYETHLIGKWHLGHSRRAYTPTLRGFDSHLGYYLGQQDYSTHLCEEKYGNGYDFRSNLSINRKASEHYDTDLFTNEALRLIRSKPKDKPMFLMINHIAPHTASGDVYLPAPAKNVDKFNDTIPNLQRRQYAGLIDTLDISVGLVVKELGKVGLLDNSIVIFASDNGGAPDGFNGNQGSNWPLRGTKNTLWEGGTRLAACIWSKSLKPHVFKSQMHAVDWLPTLLEAAGSKTHLTDLDGVSQWKSLHGFNKKHPPRNSFLYNIDDIYNNSAVRFGKWKLIQGNTSSSDLGGCPRNSSCDFRFGPSGRPTCRSSAQDLWPLIKASDTSKAFETIGRHVHKTIAMKNKKLANIKCQLVVRRPPCNAFDSPCLFDIDSDPCEMRNVADKNPHLVKLLQKMITDFNRTAIPPLPRFADPNSAPDLWGGVWTFFQDLMDERERANATNRNMTTRNVLEYQTPVTN